MNCEQISVQTSGNFYKDSMISISIRVLYFSVAKLHWSKICLWHQADVLFNFLHYFECPKYVPYSPIGISYSFLLACHTTGLSITQIPLRGQEGGILLFHYSMIYVYGPKFAYDIKPMYCLIFSTILNVQSTYHILQSVFLIPFCWHAIQRAFLSPRSHWEGKRVVYCCFIILWSMSMASPFIFNGELLRQITFSTSAITIDITYWQHANAVWCLPSKNRLERFVMVIKS